MKKNYLTPETDICLISFEKHFLDASLGGGSVGENLGANNTYDWDWDE